MSKFGQIVHEDFFNNIKCNSFDRKRYCKQIKIMFNNLNIQIGGSGLSVVCRLSSVVCRVTICVKNKYLQNHQTMYVVQCTYICM